MKIEKEFKLRDSIDLIDPPDWEIRKAMRDVSTLVLDLVKQYPNATFTVYADLECDDLGDEDGLNIVEEVSGPLVLFNSKFNAMIVKDNPFRDKWELDEYQGEWSPRNIGAAINKDAMNEEGMYKGDYLWVQDWEVKKIIMHYEPRNNKEAAQLLEKVNDL
jgi:hypothetical protein